MAATPPEPLPRCAQPSGFATRRAAASCPAMKWVRNLRLISEGPDAFYNYDFGHQPLTDTPCPDQSEGPINLIFWGDAVSAQATRLYPIGSLANSTEWGLVWS